MKKVTIIIPVFNEENFIRETINAVNAINLKQIGLEKDLVIVDDCSDDDTGKILDEMKSVYPHLKVLRHLKNKGKGAAVQTGVKASNGDVILIQDADMEYDPSEYPKLLSPLIDGKADVVFGSRFAGGEAHRVLYFWHYVGNKFLTLLSNMLTDLNLTDMESCYKVFKAEIFNQIQVKENGFGFEPEITAKVAKLAKAGKCKIYEVGISYSGRTYSEGKKINWKDGLSALRCILKYNLVG